MVNWKIKELKKEVVKVSVRTASCKGCLFHAHFNMDECMRLRTNDKNEDFSCIDPKKEFGEMRYSIFKFKGNK